MDSDDDGECPDHLFPGEGEVTDAAMVMLRKKTNGKYTLFKASSQDKHSLDLIPPIIGALTNSIHRISIWLLTAYY